jgi:hypothetical protein
MSAILFLPFKNRTNLSGFQMVKTKWPPFSFGQFENRTNLVEHGV